VRDEDKHRGVGLSTRRFLAEDNRSKAAYFKERNNVRGGKEGRKEWNIEEKGAEERKRQRRTEDKHYRVR
jgi:hypothetical protein